MSQVLFTDLPLRCLWCWTSGGHFSTNNHKETIFSSQIYIAGNLSELFAIKMHFVYLGNLLFPFKTNPPPKKKTLPNGLQ